MTIPSPKITENNLGYFSGLIIVKAATESVAHIVALYINIYPVVNLISYLKSEYLRIIPVSFIIIVKPETIPKLTIVPTKPKRAI